MFAMIYDFSFFENVWKSKYAIQIMIDFSIGITTNRKYSFFDRTFAIPVLFSYFCLAYFNINTTGTKKDCENGIITAAK